MNIIFFSNDVRLYPVLLCGHNAAAIGNVSNEWRIIGCSFTTMYIFPFLNGKPKYVYICLWLDHGKWKKINKTNEQNRSVKICNDIKIETNWNVRKTWYTFTIHILWTYRIPINDVICTDWTEVYIRFYTLVERKTKEKKNTKKKRN